MSAAAPNAATCDACGAQLGRGLLVCPGCSRLLHKEQLTALAAAATSAEQRGELAAALGAWRDALVLLPSDTNQHATISKRMQQLSAAIDGRGPAPDGVGSRAQGSGRGGKATAAVGVTLLALFKSKALLSMLMANGKLLALGLLKLPTLFSMLLYARWMSGSGAALGLGLVASIYVHEMGHVAALQRYGIAASAPMFVPGFGAFVRSNKYPTEPHQEARIGLAGPLWGACAAVLTALLGGLFGSSAMLSIASLAASLNVLNLVPFWQLDGARGLHALDRAQRFWIAGVGLLCAIAMHQWLPGIVGVVAALRAFGVGGPSHSAGDRGMLWLFASSIVVLSLIATLPVTLPGQ